ncbi:malate synthase G [Alphaproteobacteria bacterium KMM 3653]|uniref:Malate synthase G n=1 Tax=Harenicola maris TaxID=2841044 RepID=A0AAP2CKT4_9RHOB|nr:malate synthase G [Harenicola maris]
MADRIEKGGLMWDAGLAAFIENEAIPGSGVEADAIWHGMAALNTAFGEKNAALLAKRDELQGKIDAWHVEQAGKPHDGEAYMRFLGEIGYLEAEPEEVSAEPKNIDSEISSVAGPQLVVPVTNARFALNAANARWGSLYDALYGSDALGSPAPKGPYDAERGKAVVAWAKAHLDEVVPLKKGSWADVTTMAPGGGGKFMIIAGKHATELADASQYAGCNRDEKGLLTDVFLRANGLHIVLFIDRKDPVGAADPAGIVDIFLEAAVSTIIDFEDSVAVVDAEDKTLALRNWLGLMKGDLTAQVGSGEAAYTRELNPDIGFTAPNGLPQLLKGRSLMLVRNTDMLVKTDAVTSPEGAPLFEGLIDALLTALCGCHDLRREGGPMNSPKGSIYIVKPKMHGPEEVAFTCQVFAAVEQVLGLPAETIKIGIMDEEHRMSANLMGAVAAAGARIAFINTGFLDRTGSEIFTMMQAGPAMARGEMKSAPWLMAYEDRNVDIGLACGLKGRAQIGKGMWARPDDMAAMLAEKGGHLQAGATCAWVPSPTAATLHATHYHKVNVFQTLFDLSEAAGGQVRQPLSALLTLPLMEVRPDDAAIAAEVDGACQSILGYVVRWIDQGVGCSKVPDINDVALMEDRATLRISMQALGNWLKHEVITEDQVMDAMRRMAEKVDGQNAGDPAYKPMAPEFSGIAFQAACDIVFKARQQPSGYTQQILQQRRLEAKAAG